MINKTILFIEGETGFVISAIKNNLEADGYRVISCPDSTPAIESKHEQAETILYYLPALRSQVKNRISFLTSLCINHHKTLCVIGDDLGIKEALSTPSAERINAIYRRPVDVRNLVVGIRKLTEISTEFSQPKAVLMVDDDTDFLNIANNWLRNDFIVAGVRSGREALRYLDSYRPDLILLDYDMPEMDGYALMKKLKEKSMLDNIPIFFLTGRSDKEAVMRIMELKPYGYLLKSMPKEELIHTLKDVFAGKILSKKTTPQMFRK